MVPITARQYADACGTLGNEGQFALSDQTARRYQSAIPGRQGRPGCGLAWATSIEHRPEIALLGLAELLLEHYPEERTEALEHLDFAIKEFETMKMAPSLARALALRQSL